MLTHHAYIIEDSPARRAAYEAAAREREGFAPHDTAFTAERFEVLGIDDARALQARASLRTMGERAVFFLSATSIAHEAQQALLKLFEEPHEGVSFILLVPHGALLPTLRSRFLEYPHKLPAALPLQKEAQEFLAASYKTRSEWIAKFLKPARRDDGQARDEGAGEEDSARQQARDFLAALEAQLYPGLAKSREVREGLADIAHFRGYLFDRSPSLKMILEHLAATLPTIK